MTKDVYIFTLILCPFLTRQVRWPLAFLVTLLMGLLGAPGDVPAAGGEVGEWRNYNRELDGKRFSPLTQVNRENVQQLQPVWSHPAGSQSTPIVIAGVMYLSTAKGAAAVEAHTGKTLWSFELSDGRPSVRGVSYWPGEEGLSPRILFMAEDRMIALDAVTGERVQDFGKNGEIGIGVPFRSVPTIYRNVVILGAHPGEQSIGPAGNTRAFDVRTGSKLWEFNTVPQLGEVGHETWLDEGWKGRSGVNVWAFSMTVDEERGILYMPVAGAAGNYYGGDRPGNNLFADSVVAVKAETGEYLWHFQTVHHGLWDYDQPAPPALFELEKDGVRIPALALIGKTGYLFLLNRVTGEPVYAVEERPVTAGEVPGEWYSPTQPFPVKPPPLARVSFSRADLVTAEDTTEEHAAACRALWERNGGFYNIGPYTPFLYHKDGDSPHSAVQFPGGGGGVNWGGPAVDPGTAYIYINSRDLGRTGWMETKKPGGNYGVGTEGSVLTIDRGGVDGPGPYHSLSVLVRNSEGRVIDDWPCQKPPWARLIAVDAKTGEIAWEQVLGFNENLPEGKQLVGGAGSAGPTVTAGGLVFFAATTDERFRAFDAATGTELWAAKLPQMANANPMTYLGRDGRQYVAVVARDEVIVFSLR